MTDALSPSTSPVAPGDVLAGKYKVDRVLGVGGMGVVVAATHLQLHQSVALKFALPSALQNQQAVERFLREARAAVRLKSEHVAKVLDVGTLESGAPYMVMEYLEGVDLRRISSPSSPGRSRSRPRATTSSRPARRSPRPTRTASSTAISSRGTSSSPSRSAARHSSRCSTSGSPK